MLKSSSSLVLAESGYMSVQQLPNDFYKWLAISPFDKQGKVYYRLRLCSQLGRKVISCGSDPLTAITLAGEVDKKIDNLININRKIDTDELKNYVKTRLSEETGKAKPQLKVVEKNSILELWEKYKAFHIGLKQWSQNYIMSNINQIDRLLTKCPIQSINDQHGFLTWLLENESCSPKTIKKKFMLVVAAIDWASKQGIINRLTGIQWRDCLNSIKVKEVKKSNVYDLGGDNSNIIDIFKVSEVYSILDALKNDTYSKYQGKHSEFYPYAYFLWLTGCRPSEACGLRWENVNLATRKIKFCEVSIERSGKKFTQVGTKTEDYRLFPMSPELETLLKSLPKNSEYVFSRANGSQMKHGSFYKLWQGLLKKMNIRYRQPYQLRHTMISYHANNGFPLHKLAKLVGNSEGVIRNHYLQLDIERMALPDVIKP